MTSLARRIQKLEQTKFSPEEQARTRALLARLEAARRRVAAVRVSGDNVRLQIPPERKIEARRRPDAIVAILHLGRTRAGRQSLFEKCRLALAQTGQATDQDRAAAQADYAAVERDCQQKGFASIEAFMQNCREEGWLPGDSQ